MKFHTKQRMNASYVALIVEVLEASRIEVLTFQRKFDILGFVANAIYIYHCESYIYIYVVLVLRYHKH